METLVPVSHHRNHHHCYGKFHCNSPTRFGSFGSDFSGISCRTFQSASGSLPTPFKSFSSTPVAKKSFHPSISPENPFPCFSKNQNSSRRYTKSSSIPIPIKLDFGNKEEKGNVFHFYERWAGPAYSNSPPPNSLPLPKFSLPPKTTTLLDFPRLLAETDTHPIAKSAPASPIWAARSLSPDDLFGCPDSATRTLRRILNLDVTDE